MLALAVGLGWMYRGADLAKRPMHTDEAILGIKTIELYKNGNFQYDPHDFHGPFLHRAALWIGRPLGWTADNLDEVKLRLVTVFFGMALLMVPLLLSDVLGRRGSGIAALLIAVSPMMTFYSRYYIMETPFAFLVALLIVAAWRWTQSRNLLWLVLAGVVAGLLHATKETFVLNLAAMFAGWAVAKAMVGSFRLRTSSLSFGSSSKNERSPMFTGGIVVGVAILVSVAIFSNGFRDWQAVKDSVFTYQNYVQRAGGSGHEKPWHYYLTLLFWRKNDFTWSEALIGGLAALGMMNAFTNDRRPSHHRAFLIFLSVYSVALLAGYSVLRYKTPWSVLCVDHAFALLAGVGLSGLFRALEFSPIGKTTVFGLFAAGLYNLCLQTSLAIDYTFPTVRYSADERNPYVYSHTSPNLVQLAKRIHELTAKSAAGKDTPIQVINSEQGWPLPWYLRDLNKVGYQAEIPDSLNADIIVADLDKDEALRAKLKGACESSPYGLRPGIMLTLIVKKPLWDKFMGVEPAPPPPPQPVPAPQPTAPIIEGPPAPPPTPLPSAPASPEPMPPPSPSAAPRAQIVTDDEPVPPVPGAPMPPPAEGTIPKAKPAPESAEPPAPAPTPPPAPKPEL